MHVNAAASSPDTAAAAAIVQRCVHCGFCNATCPTYQLLGDELDGPRGRIYQIKQLLEGESAGVSTRLHLDRCLTCRACETTCPSGVEYGRLLDIGRDMLEAQVPRPALSRLQRSLLAGVLTGRWFAPLLWLGRLLRPILPPRLRAMVPPLAPRPNADIRAGARRRHSRQVLLLAGCVQPALSPNIQQATVQVLDALDIEARSISEAGCCGAIHFHLGDVETARRAARRNIDAWWPAIESGAEAIVMNASGCGTTVADYGHLLRDDPRYADRAARVSALCIDLAKFLLPLGADLQRALRASDARVVFHPPCTLQHGQRIQGAVEALLARLGATVMPFADPHLCCGSAGTYSVLQGPIAGELRARKLQALEAPGPQEILSANIGCITHLAGASRVPVRHWVEWLADRLQQMT